MICFIYDKCRLCKSTRSVITSLLFPSLQRKPNSRPNILPASYMNSLSMCFDNVFAYSETETAAGKINTATFFRAIKTFEYPGQMFFGNADTIVA